MLRKLLIFFILIGCWHVSYSQDYFQVTGTITDTDGNPIPLTHIRLKDSYLGTTSDENGKYKLHIVRKEKLILQFSCIGFKEKEIEITPDDEVIYTLDLQLDIEVNLLDEVAIQTLYSQSTNLTKINSKELEMLPNASGSVESLLKTLPGVSSNSELSSQYSVRGGNFDENMVYVNDIEVYRPFLIRSGQQEGLSFVNSDMVSAINFSAGGFDAKFGDKMSSVLDIQYNKPQQFSGKVSGSLLGGSLHLEDAIGSKNQFTYNIGLRYKTSRYLLNSMDVKGDYNPSFYDIQSYLTYRINRKLSIDFLGNYALNTYDFTPETRETKFGTFQNSLGLTVFYDGYEHDKFETMMGALSINFNDGDKLSLKLIGSAYHTNEVETFDILGEYNINELDKTIGSETYGDSIMNLATGSFLNHARNYLDAYVYSLALKGGYFWNNNELRWGATYSIEEINDIINEWKMLDSAGYSLPYFGDQIILYHSARARNNLYNHRISGYLQDVFKWRISAGDLFVNAGIRFHYWEFNREMVISPRILFSLKPYWTKNLTFRLSGGYYYQPPFYKEMKNTDGIVNQDIKAQKSIHIVFGSDYYFKAWDRPFKLTAEAYYKYMDDLIPYKYDNVRIDYAGDNLAKGYAYGLDLKVNGEFVQGIESWASLSLMKTQEDIYNDFYYDQDDNIHYPGYYRRPTDQLLNFSMYFQDYIPRNPTYTLQLSIHYGSRLPVASPNKDRYDLISNLPSYKRVDLGFSKVFNKQSKLLQGVNAIDKIYVSLEVFNLLGINNTNSVLWVKTVTNQSQLSGYYAVPNYLTSRRINLKLTAKF